MINVLCVLKTGGDFDERYVINLRRGVAKYLRKPHRFICLNNVHDKDVFDTDNGVQWSPLKHGWPGWYAKMEMFRPDLERYGRFLYFDLDTLITGDLSDIASYEGRRCIVSDWNWGTPSQSVLSFAPGSMRELWEGWLERPQHWMEAGNRCNAPNAGDQHVLNEVCGPDFDRFQDLYPKQIVSFKKHCRTPQGLPNGTRVVCFHGKPRPHQAIEMEPWVADYWNAALGFRD